MEAREFCMTRRVCGSDNFYLFCFVTDKSNCSEYKMSTPVCQEKQREAFFLSNYFSKLSIKICSSSRIFKGCLISKQLVSLRPTLIITPKINYQIIRKWISFKNIEILLYLKSSFQESVNKRKPKHRLGR